MELYRDNLRPWAIFRCEPPVDNICVARFRKRNDADEYLKILRTLTPAGIFKIIFDKQEPSEDNLATEQIGVLKS